jgi:hypothetical protein
MSTAEGPIVVDTSSMSSGRFQGQWSFINPPAHYGHNTRSLPPSSGYLQSDRSSILPQTGSGGATPFFHLNTSGSNLSRVNAASIGSTSYSTATAPSQPVLSRIHSNVASNFLNPIARPPRRREVLNRDDNKLPPLSAYSFEGILAAIQEDIEEDLNGIADIWGRSRLALADQHDAHLPPTGEIRAVPLQSVAEASSSTERLADDVMILHENASLVDGSQNGSQAYGLLERLQALPRTGRMYSDVILPLARAELATAEDVRNSSPAVMTIRDSTMIVDAPSNEPAVASSPLRAPLHLLQSRGSPTEAAPRNSAVVSEVWLSAGANGVVVSDPPVVSEAGRQYPLYSFDESQLFGGNEEVDHVPEAIRPPAATFTQRIQRLLLLEDLQRSLLWPTTPAEAGSTNQRKTSGAENHLRDILGRHEAGSAPSASSAAHAKASGSGNGGPTRT